MGDRFFLILASLSLVLLSTALCTMVRVLRTRSSRWLRTEFLVAALLIWPVAICDLLLITGRISSLNQRQELFVGAALLSSAMGTSFLIQIVARGVSRVTDLEYVAHMDPVTQVMTRRRITQALEERCLLARCKTDQLSILLIDVDEFKKVNDAYGHQTGDAVLLRIAQTMAVIAGKSAFIGRYGGDEFLVILPDMNLPAVRTLADCIRHRVELIRVAVGADTHVSATISVGMHTMTSFQESADELVEGADRALYRAKRDGRNTVCELEERELWCRRRDPATYDLQLLPGRRAIGD